MTHIYSSLLWTWPTGSRWRRLVVCLRASQTSQFNSQRFTRSGPSQVLNFYRSKRLNTLTWQAGFPLYLLTLGISPGLNLSSVILLFYTCEYTEACSQRHPIATLDVVHDLSTMKTNVIHTLPPDGNVLNIYSRHMFGLIKIQRTVLEMAFTVENNAGDSGSSEQSLLLAQHSLVWWALEIVISKNIICHHGRKQLRTGVFLQWASEEFKCGG